MWQLQPLSNTLIHVPIILRHNVTLFNVLQSYVTVLSWQQKKHNFITTLPLHILTSCKKKGKRKQVILLGRKFFPQIARFMRRPPWISYQIPLDLPPGGARIRAEDLFGMLSSIWAPGGGREEEGGRGGGEGGVRTRAEDQQRNTKCDCFLVAFTLNHILLWSC